MTARRRRRIQRNMLMLLLVIGTSLVGTVHGLWFENLEIGGTVTTGEMTSVWFYRSCDEKPQGQTTATWSVRPRDNQWGQDELVVKVGNAYPNFQLYCEAHIANTGSVPIRVKNIIVINSNPTGVSVTAVEAEPGKVIQPCGFSPDWPDVSKNDKGYDLKLVPAHCRLEIQFTIKMKPTLPRGSSVAIGFVVEFVQA